MQRDIRWPIFSTAALALGSLGPWATVTFLGVTVSKEGTSGDGILTLILAAVAAFLIFRSPDHEGRQGGVVFCAILALGISVYDLANISNKYNGLVHPGWGLYLCVAAGASLLAAAWKRPAVTAAPEDTPGAD